MILFAPFVLTAQKLRQQKDVWGSGIERTKAMAGEKTTAVISAVAAIGCALISGAFTLKASNSSDNASRSSVEASKANELAKTASDQATTASKEANETSSTVAVGAVAEGYATTVKPFFDQTKDLTEALEARIDVMQRQIHELTMAIAAIRPGAVGPQAAPPTPAAPLKNLVVPARVTFRPDVLAKAQWEKPGGAALQR